MSTEEKRYTVGEAHKFFAVDFNQKTWALLSKAERTAADAEQMVYFAHASLSHWLQCGTLLNHQRGEYLIARVYCELGLADAALRHAMRTAELSNQCREELKDFDKAYLLEIVARSRACAGRLEDAAKYYAAAEAEALKIADEEDRKFYLTDLRSGPWYGLKIQTEG